MATDVGIQFISGRLIGYIGEVRYEARGRGRGGGGA